MKRLLPAAAMALWAVGAAHAGLKIRFQGNADFGRRKLLEVINPDPEEYSQDGLRAWREDAEFYLADLYRSHGYFEASVHGDLTPRGKDPEDWDALFSIREGPRYAFGTVRVRGARLRQAEDARSAAGPDTAVSASDAAVPDDRDGAPGPGSAGPRAALPASPTPLNPRAPAPDTQTVPLAGPEIDTAGFEARPGKPFRQDALLADRRSLLRRFGDAGFVRVEAEDRVEVRPDRKAVDVEYRVDPGVPVVFDTLVVRNLRAPPNDTLPGITREGILQGLVPYSRGDTVRLSSNDKLVEKLQYTGAFNFVRIKDSLRPEGDGRSTLYLYTEEHVPGNLRSSVFYETQYGAGVSLDARHSNLAGTLNEIRSGFSFANERQTVYAGYGSPLTFGALIRFDQDMDFNWYQDQHPLHDGLGPFRGDFRWTNSTRFTWPWKYWLRLVADAQFEAKSRMIGAVARERDLSLNFIQTAFLTFVDQEMDPARGVRLAFTWGNGGPLQRNDVFRFAQFRHNWLEAKTSHYYPVPGLRMLKLATRLDGGRFFGEGGPNSDRFFLGGSRSVRSYDFQHLCPMGPADTVCVAQDSSLAYVQASAEVRAEPFWFLNPRGKLHSLAPLQFVPFLDYGKVWDVRHAPGFTGLGGDLPPGEGYAAGLGLRYPLLGIFNIRTDLVLKGSGGHRFWLDLAQAF